MKLSVTVFTGLIVAVVIFSDSAGCASSRDYTGPHHRPVRTPSKIKRLTDLLKKDHLTIRESIMHVPVGRNVIQERVNCSSDKHMCDDGTECILQSWVCDGGSPDCDDGSDELDCQTRPCYQNRFKCADTGRCIRGQSRCNYQNDCEDGSDEVDCPPMTCPPDYFKCLNVSRCVPNYWICDGDNDCGDLSDETECGSIPCPPHRPLRCESSGVCYSEYHRCDGYRYCSDGSDELNCYPAQCTAGEYPCANQAGCIPNRWVCDGEGDCSDRSDEVGCEHNPPKATTEAPTDIDDEDEYTSSVVEPTGAPEVDTSETVKPEVCDKEALIKEIIAALTQSGEDDVKGNGEPPRGWVKHRRLESIKKILSRRSMKSRKAMKYALEKLPGRSV